MSLSGILRSRVWPAAWQLFTRSFVLVGLPLLAWGLADTAGFFAEPARAGYAAVCIGQALVLAWLLYVTPPQPPTERHHDLPEWHGHVYEVILILAAYGDRREVLTWAENPALRWVGVGIALLGVSPLHLGQPDVGQPPAPAGRRCTGRSRLAHRGTLQVDPLPGTALPGLVQPGVCHYLPLLDRAGAHAPPDCRSRLPHPLFREALCRAVRAGLASAPPHLLAHLAFPVLALARNRP